MATDATGTPTAKGIPKFNTAVDPASGKGTNAMMDAIDLLFDSYAAKPSGIVSGEVPVWNGSTWVRSSVTNIGPSSLGSGSPSSSTFLRGDGTWAAAGGATLVTALPGSPSDGDEIIFVDSTTAPTYQWHFRYISAKASNKWIYLGGAPIFSEVATLESTTSTTYTALATAGPSITLPVTGDYMVAVGANIEQATTTTNFMSYDIGATTAVDADAYETKSGSGNPDIMGHFERKKAGLGAVTLTAKYRVGSATSGTFKKRWMRVTPVAIGG